MAKGKAKKETKTPEPEKKVAQQKVVQPAAPAKIRKIAIVGCSDTKKLAPFGDESWEIWAMNNAFVHTPRRNLWFEIHPIKQENGIFYRRELIRPGVFKWVDNFRGQSMRDYMQSLAELDIPVLMQQHWDIIPKSVPYPLQEIIQQFGRYFTNSVSWMIALACRYIIEDKAAGKIANGHIGCWGVDMATTTEYGHQRPSCEFFLGVAAGLGIMITVPPEADLLKARFLYGFEEREQVEWEAKMINILKGMADRRNKAMQKYEMAKKQIDQYLGAEEAVKEIQKVWSNLMDPKIWRDQTG